MTIGGDGAEVDWTVGYGPPPERFHERMMKMVAGNGTYRALSEALARNPKDAAAAFLLADKWAYRVQHREKERILSDGRRPRSGGDVRDLHRRIRQDERLLCRIRRVRPGRDGPRRANRSPAPMKAFMAKYPKSQLLKQAYARLSSYYGSAPSKEEATAFFAEYTAKYPDDPEVLAAWLGRITRDKGDFAKGDGARRQDQDPQPGQSRRPDQQDPGRFLSGQGRRRGSRQAYGKDFMKNRAFGVGLDMVDYANYWAGKGSNLDAAVAAVETAMKLYPESSYFVQQAAGVYIKAGREAKALEMFGPAFAKAHGPTLRRSKAMSSFWGTQGKNLDDALAAGRRLVEIKPIGYYGWYALSVVLLARKDYDGALKAAEKTVELADDMFKDYYRKNIERSRPPKPRTKNDADALIFPRVGTEAFPVQAHVRAERLTAQRQAHQGDGHAPHPDDGVMEGLECHPPGVDNLLAQFAHLERAGQVGRLV